MRLCAQVLDSDFKSFLDRLSEERFVEDKRLVEAIRKRRERIRIVLIGVFWAEKNKEPSNNFCFNVARRCVQHEKSVLVKLANTFVSVR